MSKTALALQHVAFEDLGLFAPILAASGYDLRYRDIGLSGLDPDQALAADLLIVLGGPIGAYEEDKYPFLTEEIALLERRLATQMPTLGICLGAQLMARALGAVVYPGPAKEIGFGQFHPEAGAPGFERWLIGHTAELGAAGRSIPVLRAYYERLAPQLAHPAEQCLNLWLEQLQM